MKYLKNVVTLKYLEEKCIGCKRCEEVCPHQVFTVNEKAKILDIDACIECGACQMNCPTKAISVDAGVGCASAIVYAQLKKIPIIKKFIKNKCC